MVVKLQYACMCNINVVMVLNFCYAGTYYIYFRKGVYIHELVGTHKDYTFPVVLHMWVK
jgi:hypothetical protein